MDFQVIEEKEKPPEFNVNDTLMEPREIIRLKNNYQAMAIYMEMETHFNLSEVQSLLLIFMKIVPQSAVNRRKGMDINKFKNVIYKIFGLSKDYFLQRMFSVFDIDQNRVITMDEWLVGLSIILKGSLHEKSTYVYKIYSRGAAAITHNDIRNSLQHTLIRTPEGVRVEEFIRDIAYIVLRKLDIDRDNNVSLEDFQEAVVKQPLMLQCLGPCLPSASAVTAFLATFTPFNPHSGHPL